MRSKLRLAVLLGLLVAQVGTVVALAFISGRLTSTASTEHTNALLDSALAEAAEEISSQLEPAESIVAVTSDLASAPGFEPSDFTAAFRGALERSPQLAGIYIGTEDGAFVYVRRTDDGFRIKSIAINDDGTPGVTELEYQDGAGRSLGVTQDLDDHFDPTTRPWYQNSLASPGRVAWTDPYVFFTSNQLGITASKPIVVDGRIVGVVGADIELGSLSSFLATLQEGTDSGVIVVNQDGTVIAHPDPGLAQQQTSDGWATVSVTEIADPYARAAIAVLVQQGSGDPGSQSVGLFDDDVHGPSQAAFRSVPVGDGSWTIGVFGPDQFLTADLASAQEAERTLTLVVGVLGVLLFALVAFSATRPIRDLEHRARTDALTGLANRRTILARADVLAAADGPRAAAMIDLDFFKVINDSYGHHVGDIVLEAVAHRISSSLRDDAHVGRVGGEEFVVLLPGMGPHEAELACERIATAIRSTPITTPRGALDATASIGVALATEPCTRRDLLDQADAALLHAKKLGRNQTVVRSVETSATVAETVLI